MNLKLSLLLLTGTILGACSGNSSTDEVAGGGFETSDLHVAVLDTSGNLVAGARVWLLQDQIDSTIPSPALDSVVSGPLGQAGFPKPTAGRIGVEAWRGDTLVGFQRNIDIGSRDTFKLVLRRPRVLALPCSGFPDSSVLLLPGSHFPQTRPHVCTDSFRILVPPGPVMLLAFPGGLGMPPRVLHVQGDSLPPWRPFGPPPGGNGPPPHGIDPAWIPLLVPAGG